MIQQIIDWIEARDFTEVAIAVWALALGAIAAAIARNL